MGEVVLIYGKSGTGKSRSLKEFAEDEIFLVQGIKKRLPFQKKFKYTYTQNDVNKIINGLQKMPTKTAVIDDAGYILTNEFMEGHSKPKKGASTFDLYNDIADNFWKLIMAVKELPEDTIVYLIMHEESTDYGDVRLKTIGKLLNDKVCIEGMCTVVLRCMVEGNAHVFYTQSSGNDISKSPEGMFEMKIPNDLKFVDSRIREYWGLNGGVKDGE